MESDQVATVPSGKCSHSPAHPPTCSVVSRPHLMPLHTSSIAPIVTSVISTILRAEWVQTDDINAYGTIIKSHQFLRKIKIWISTVVTGLGGSRRRCHRVVVEDRSVAPVWPRWMAPRHRSASGRCWSWRSWSIQRLRGRPELRTQSRSGRLPSDVSTCSRNAWWAGMLGDILATCPKMASRRLLMLSITGHRPVCTAFSKLRPWL